MKKAILILVLLIVSISIGHANDTLKLRPAENSGTTKVMVSIYVIDLENIDNRDQSFTLDVIVRLKWHDERLANSAGIKGLNEVWQPNVQIFNLRNVEARFPEIVKIIEGGEVQYTQRYYATLSSPLDFRKFPFDVQTLPITLLSFGYSQDEIELISETNGGTENFSISDWHVVPEGAKTSVMKANLFDDSQEVINRPRLDYTFKATRQIAFYYWKVLAPLMVILFLSWAVFWIDPSQVGAQIGVSGTSILSLIAFLFRLESILPPVSYLTHMDHFIFTSLVLVFFAYVEALVSTTIALKGNQKLALKLDFICRITYPVIFIIILIVFWIK